MQVRILHTDRPRIPGEGSSALGKSGPKARLKSVVDGKQVENAGVSSEMQVRILHTDRPRIPGEGSSALGKSGPKARLKSVVDGKQVDIPVAAHGVMQ